jgi:NOL1/NOP2/fmu family ribosome biogenesis protein
MGAVKLKAAFVELGGIKNSKQPKNNQAKLGAGEIEIVKAYLRQPDAFCFFKINGEIIALPSFLENELMVLQSALYIKKAGIKMGNIIRNELIPHHELALSAAINPSLPWLDADMETALNYLRREEININCALKGWVLLKYLDLNLGWLKILPNRINNYYPKDWRILNK